MDAPPETISHARMREIIVDPPELTPRCVLVTVGDHMYKRESDTWYLLDPPKVNDEPS